MPVAASPTQFPVGWLEGHQGSGACCASFDCPGRAEISGKLVRCSLVGSTASGTPYLFHGLPVVGPAQGVRTRTSPSPGFSVKVRAGEPPEADTWGVSKLIVTGAEAVAGSQRTVPPSKVRRASSPALGVLAGPIALPNRASHSGRHECLWPLVESV
jgi:hypothetical protein